MMKTFGRHAAILAMALLLLACSGGASDESSAVAAKGYPPMDSSGLDAYLAEHTGKPAILFFWTTWCPSCKQQIPEMEQLRAARGDEVTVFSVSLDEKVEALDAFFKGRERTLPVFFGDQVLAARFDVEAIPTLVVFDAQGKLVMSRPGVFPLPMLQALTDKLVAR